MAFAFAFAFRLVNRTMEADCGNVGGNVGGARQLPDAKQKGGIVESAKWCGYGMGGYYYRYCYSYSTTRAVYEMCEGEHR